MEKHKGGKGKKAEYQTTVVRVPIDIKDEVDLLVNQFHTNRFTKPVTNIIQVDVSVAIALAKIDGESLCTECYLDLRDNYEEDAVEYFGSSYAEIFKTLLEMADIAHPAIQQIADGYAEIDADSIVSSLIEYKLIKKPIGIKPVTGNRLAEWLFEQGRNIDNFSWAIAAALKEENLEIFVTLYDNDTPVNKHDYWLQYFTKSFGKFEQNYWRWIDNPVHREVSEHLNELLDKVPAPGSNTCRVFQHLSDKINPFYKTSDKNVIFDFLENGEFTKWGNSCDELLLDFVDCIESLTLIFPREDGGEGISDRLYELMDICFTCNRNRLDEIIEMSKSIGETCWTILRIHSGASTDEIKAAYRKRASQLHPDVNTKKDAGKEFHKLKNAYDEARLKQTAY